MDKKLSGVTKKDSKKVDYFIPTTITPLSEKEKEELNTEKQSKEKEIWENKIEKTLSETEGYNKEISNNLPDLSDFDLVGNYVLIRPFKIEVVEKKESGIILMNKTTEHYTDERTNKTKTRDMLLPFQMKGIVVKYGDAVQDDIKTKSPVGSLVAFMPQPLHVCMFYIDTNVSYTNFDVEDYFTVKIPVSQLERIYKVNKYVEV